MNPCTSQSEGPQSSLAGRTGVIREELPPAKKNRKRKIRLEQKHYRECKGQVWGLPRVSRHLQAGGQAEGHSVFMEGGRERDPAPVLRLVPTGAGCLSHPLLCSCLSNRCR